MTTCSYDDSNMAIKNFHFASTSFIKKMDDDDDEDDFVSG